MVKAHEVTGRAVTRLAASHLQRRLGLGPGHGRACKVVRSARRWTSRTRWPNVNCGQFQALKAVQSLREAWRGCRAVSTHIGAVTSPGAVGMCRMRVTSAELRLRSQRRTHARRQVNRCERRRTRAAVRLSPSARGRMLLSASPGEIRHLDAIPSAGGGMVPRRVAPRLACPICHPTSRPPAGCRTPIQSFTHASTSAFSFL